MRIFKFLPNKLQINFKPLFSTKTLYSIYTKITKEKIYSVIVKGEGKGKEVMLRKRKEVGEYMKALTSLIKKNLPKVGKIQYND